MNIDTELQDYEAALFYLLERLRLALENPDETARVKLMVVDEAWRYLQDPVVLSYLAEAAKTWRKKNTALIVATQSAVDVTGTVGAEVLLESMPTNMLERLNEEIKRRTYVVRIFPNRESCLREIRALTVEMHENWIEALRYLKMEFLKEVKKEALRRV